MVEIQSRRSSDVFDGYEQRAWRQLAQRQRSRDMEFSLGRREGVHVWNLEGDHRLLDCGGSGGVHSLGHRHPEIIAALHAALDQGLDAGLWAMPSAELLAFQDALSACAPTRELSRSVLTCTSTQSIDLALMFCFRVTGRRRVVAYRHGYHGHGGLAAVVTGSVEEGVLEHYALNTQNVGFFEDYGDLGQMRGLIDDDCAAVILEPMNYETFQPAEASFLPDLQQLCRDRGALLIIDETRTGLGRSGRLWMTERYDLQPDILISGKGLGGGVYPISAVLTTPAIYDACMNAKHWGYMSSMGGNPLAAVIAGKVLEVSQRPALLANVERLQNQLTAGFRALCARYPTIFREKAVLGGIATLGLVNPAHARTIAGDLFRLGILCHSVSLVAPLVVKFFPALVSDDAAGDELLEGLDRFAAMAG